MVKGIILGFKWISSRATAIAVEKTTTHRNVVKLSTKVDNLSSELYFWLLCLLEQLIHVYIEIILFSIDSKLIKKQMTSKTKETSSWKVKDTLGTHLALAAPKDPVSKEEILKLSANLFVKA